MRKKEAQIEWYRKYVVPVYREEVEKRIARETLECIRKRKKEGTDVPKHLQ